MTEAERRDYAWGYERMAGGGEVSEALLEAASRLLDAAEQRIVGPDQLILDGWRWDHKRHVWVVPARDVAVEPTPMRTGAADPGGGGSAGGGGGGGVDMSMLADDELDELSERAAAHDRWQHDPAQRALRWDRRALMLGRALRR